MQKITNHKKKSAFTTLLKDTCFAKDEKQENKGLKFDTDSQLPLLQLRFTSCKLHSLMAVRRRISSAANARIVEFLTK